MDLGRGAAPRFKSAEFFVFTLMVTQKNLNSTRDRFEIVLHLLGSGVVGSSMYSDGGVSHGEAWSPDGDREAPAGCHWEST